MDEGDALNLAARSNSGCPGMVLRTARRVSAEPRVLCSSSAPPAIPCAPDQGHSPRWGLRHVWAGWKTARNRKFFLYIRTGQNRSTYNKMVGFLGISEGKQEWEVLRNICCFSREGYAQRLLNLTPPLFSLIKSNEI